MTSEETKTYIFNLIHDKVIKDKVVSQAELADKLGIAKSTVSTWFTRGSIPNAELMYKISVILNIDLYNLYGEVNPNALTDEEKHAVELYRNNKDLFKAIEKATKKD